jgi:hypothetical protein
MSAFTRVVHLYFLRLVAALAVFALLKVVFRFGVDWRFRGKPPYPLDLPRPGRAPLLNKPERCFLSISSDDWGRWADAVPIFPDIAFASSHEELQTAPAGFWYRLATSETREDLENLGSLLERLNADVTYEKRVVLTPHWIVGGPDFEAMRKLSRPLAVACHGRDSGRQDRCGYIELLLHDSAGGLSRPPYSRGDLRDLYRKLYMNELWHPEYHGRSHFSVSRWLRELNIAGSKAEACFNHSLVCGSSEIALRSEFDWFDEHQHLLEWIQGGLHSFRAFWGYRPRVLSSPHNTWTPWLADAARYAGFIGTSLGDVQKVYRMDGGLVITNRPRFDAFYPGFDCEKSVNEIIKTLNSTKFANIMWHAQNAMRSTYSLEEYEKHLSCFERLIGKVRAMLPGLAIVTESELHQIRVRGWSAEVWNSSIVYRNYQRTSVDVYAADPTAFGTVESWHGKDLVMEELQGKASKTGPNSALHTGDTIRLYPDSIIRVRVSESRATIPSS